MPPADGLNNVALRESLLSVMDRKHHWFWDHLNSPEATRRELLIHFQQEWEVYVRDFPLFLRRVHDRCPHPAVRAAIAENIAEEEEGRVSGAGPHAELFLYMMEGLGFSRDQFESVPLLPAAAAYRRWLDETSRAWWLVGAAVSMIFVEGSIQDRDEIAGDGPGGASDDGPAPANGVEVDFSRHPLVVHHGLDPKYLELKRVHRKVEGGHRQDAYYAILEHARTAAHRRAVVAALTRSLGMWRAFRENVARPPAGS